MPLSQNRLAGRGWALTAAELPLYLAAGLMALGLVLIVIASRRGRDYPASEPSAVVPDPML